MPLNMIQGQIWPLCQHNAALRGQIFQKLSKILSYTSTPWSPRKFLPWALNSGQPLYHCKHASKRICFIIIQSEISRIISAMAFMYAWAWTSFFICVNTQQAKCAIDFTPSEFTSPLKRLLIWLSGIFIVIPVWTQMAPLCWSLKNERSSCD